MASPSRTESEHWWHDAVVYQVYIRSFADSHGDGVGDLDGIRARLDHLASLEIDAIWLTPCYPSPQRDHGYDVSDYFAIHDEYGTLDTFDALVREAGERGIRLLMDIVPNHCSTEHPWFVEAIASDPGSEQRSRFWFRDGQPSADGDPHGAPPNNWVAAFGGSAWTRASADDPQWYLGTFTPHQSDFHHPNPDVKEMFADVLEFWFDRGVEGIRVDAIAPVGKHPELPPQPPVPEGTGLLQVTWENPYTVFRPEGHDVWREFRATIDGYMDRHPGRDLMMVAEAYMHGRPELVRRFVNREQFHQAFAFDLMLAAWNKESIETALIDSFVVFEEGVPPTWTLNNHDVQRIVTRLGRDNATEPHATTSHLEDSWLSVDVELGRRRAAAAIALAMALPGSIYLYQGEELGLPEVLDLPEERRQDPVFHHTDGARIGRDGCRIPLPWTSDPTTSFGFSSRKADGGDPDPPWLPQPDWWGDYAADDLDGREGSMLELYRELIGARREFAIEQGGHASVVELGDGLVAVRRGELVVVLNVTRDPVSLDLDHPELTIARPVVASAPDEMHTAGVIPPDSTIWFVS